MQKNILLILLLAFSLCFSQTQKDIETYKSNFFLYPTIGTEKSLAYVEKIFKSHKNTDQVFAYTAKRHLLTISDNYSQDIYLPKINYYLNLIEKTPQNSKDLSNIYNILGNTDKANENLQSALNNFHKAEFFAEKNNDLLQLNKVKGNIASVKGDIGLWEDAIKETKEAIKLLKENQEKYPDDYYKIQLYNQYNNLGNWYLQRYSDNQLNKKDLDSSKIIYKTILKQDLNQLQKALVYENLGSLSSLKNNYSEAINNYQKSLSSFYLAGSDKNVISTKYNLAYSYYRLNKYSEAKKFFKNVLSEEKDVSSFKYLFSNQYLAKIYINENKRDSANYFLDTFLDLYSKKTTEEKKEYANVYKKIENKTLSSEIESIRNENSSIKTRSVIIIVIIFAILICLSVFVIRQIKEKKKANEKLKHLLAEIEKNKVISTNNFPKITINDEKEKQIVEGLKK